MKRLGSGLAVVIEFLDFCDEDDIPTVVTARPANDGRDEPQAPAPTDAATAQPA